MSDSGGSRAFQVLPVGGIGEVSKGADVGALIAAAVELDPGDIVVIAQKIVSKAEGRQRRLTEITPGAEARRIGLETARDPRLVELVLSESRSIVRATEQALIVRTHHGFVCANAGIDASNVEGKDSVLLLPVDPDYSAREIRKQLEHGSTRPLGVIIADSFGRAWRIGQADIAIGAAGVRVSDDWRGRADSQGRGLTATEVAIADELAAAADLARSKDAGVPAVTIRGLGHLVSDVAGSGAAALRRAEHDDLFT